MICVSCKLEMAHYETALDPRGIFLSCPGCGVRGVDMTYIGTDMEATQIDKDVPVPLFCWEGMDNEYE